ncbi:tripartite tricarboxylate transporter substrate binding protein [Pigmentiphaga soli]|uniref:Tripartite tricarboxylate transporter substrate binding protein n=2 Tax=Pigmentiphaga soli TaxID=1007095 RepID=A0ABP8HA79_9BURK
MAAAAAIAAASGCIGTHPAHAQDVDGYPTRPITMVLPYSPSGSGDRFARVLGQEVEKTLGQPIVIEYRAGGGTNIGTDYVVRSKPDGYTLLLAGTPLTVNPSLYKKLSFSVSDLASITMVSISPYLVVTGPKLPVNTFQEFIAYAKANPNKVNYASAGIGSGAHLAGALMNQMAGIDMNHISYKSSSQALTDLIGGQVQLNFSPLVVSTNMAEAGRLKALAVTSLKRSATLPNVPTVSESGLEGYEILGWYGIMAPKGTPDPIIQKLNKAFVDAMHEPTVIKALAVDGIELIPGSPQDMDAFLKRTEKQAARIVQLSGARIE